MLPVLELRFVEQRLVFSSAGVHFGGHGAVEEELDLRALHQDPGLVPFADRLRPFFLAGDDVVKAAGDVPLVRLVGVFVAFLLEGIEDLILRPGLVGRAVFLGRAPHDAGVALLGDLPLAAEIEVGVLLRSEQVAAAASGQGDRAVLHLPLLLGLVRLERPPAVKGLAVEEQFEAFLLFLGREGVGF